MANRRYIDFPIASTSGDTDIILIWQGGANKQTTKATFLSGLPENLDELNDVAISGLTNGQILRYDSVTGKWENTDQGNLDLNDLNDVSIVSPSNGQVLVYNSSTSRWENSSGGFVPYTGAVTTVNLGAQTIQAGSFVKAGGTSAQFLKANGSVDSTAYGTGSVTSVALTMPTAFTVGGSPITTAGTLAVTGAGTVGQYIRGDGSLADFPESSGGGSSVSYYLNGSVAQGTIGGVAYKELNKVPILGAGTDFTINADGYIASFLTDAGDPNLLEIPGGNWNFETYFSASSGGGSPTFYVELYKVNSGGTATLIASNSTFPELIAFGTNIISYFSTLAVPTTALALTDRLAIRYYVTHSGRTITLHTEDNHLCQIITTFTTGLTALNGLTAQIQNFAVGTSGTDFAISSATATHTFNLPTASATNRGALSSADWTTFNGKQNALTNPVTGTGTTNYLPKFTGTSTIGNSNIQDNGSLVSVGVAANFSSSVTALSLDVISASGVGSSAATGLARFITAGTSNGIAVGQSNSSRYTAILANEHIIYNDDFFMRTNGNFPLSIGTNNTTNLRFFSDGNMLIQTGGTFTNNGARLQVSGTSTFSDGVTFNGSNNVIRSGNELRFNRTDNLIYTQLYDGGNANGFVLDNRNGDGFSFQSAGTNQLRIASTGAATFSSSVTAGGKLTISNTGENILFSSLGTSAGFLHWSSAGVDMYLGNESSTGGSIFSGSSSYASVFGNKDNKNLEFFSGAKVLTITSSGAGTFTGNVRAKGGSASGGYYFDYQSDSASRSFRIANENLVFADFVIQRSTTRTGTTYENLLYFDANRVPTFASLGTGTVTATSGTLSTVSDLSYKIDDGFIDSAIQKVLSLKPRYFYWNEKSGLPTDIRQLGFYAQEVNQALGEEAANTPQNKNTPWGISDRSMIAMLTKAIQELKQEIDILKN